MDRINFLTSYEEPDAILPESHSSYHTQENSDREYTHHILRQKGGVYDELLTRIPEHSSIMDVGSGPGVSFSAEQLKQRDHSLITVDFDPQILMMHADAVRCRIGLDLRAIPESLNAGRPLPEALSLLKRATNVEDVRTQIQLLIDLLGEQPVGCYILSQLLIYLSPDVAKRVLSICMHNIASGGTVALFERSPKQIADMPTFMNGSTDGFAEAKALATVIGEFDIQEFLLIPIVPNEIASRWAGQMQTARNQDLVIQELFHRIGETVTLEKVIPTEQNLTQTFEKRGDSVALNTLAQRVLYVTKRK